MNLGRRLLLLVLLLLAGWGGGAELADIDLAAADAGTDFDFGHLRVRREPDQVSFSSEAYELVLDVRRNFVIRRLSGRSGVMTLFDYGELFVVTAAEDAGAGAGRQTRYEGQGAVQVTSVRLSGGRHSACLQVLQAWPGLQVRKVVEFFAGRPYIRLAFHMQATAPFRSERVTMNLGTSPDFGAVVCIDNGSPAWRMHRPGQWFNLPRSQADRWFAYVQPASASAPAAGVALIGADPWFWKQLPGMILGSGRKQGGFTAELNQWRRRQVRAGDAVFFDLFLAPFQGDAVEACRALQDRIMPGL